MFPLSDTETSGNFPFWTVTFIAINVIVFILELITPHPEQIINWYALVPSFVKFSHLPTLLPFISSQFLHASFIHVASNLWFLQIFGDNVEKKFGLLLYPLLYLLSGIIGGLSQYLLDPSSTIPILGASGAIAGILGAYMAFFPYHTVKTLVPAFGYITTVNLPAFIVLILWFITQLFNNTAVIISSAVSRGGVAYMSHLFGFITGWLFALLFKHLSPKRYA